MLLGYNTNGFAHHRLEDAVEILAELGYQSVALTLDYHALNPFDADLPAQLQRVRTLLERHRLHSVIETGARFLLDPRRKHQPTLLSPTAEQRERRLDFLRRAVDIGAQLGSDAISYWSGRAEDEDSEVLWERLVSGCRALSDYAARRGQRLAFEPEPGMFIDTMERFEQLYQRVDHPLFGLTLDLGHLHCQGELPMSPHLERWQDRLWNIHIEDMRRGVHDHLLFGEGDLDFTPLRKTLRAIDYRGGLHVELSRHSHDAVEAARQALTFLRNLPG